MAKQFLPVLAKEFLRYGGRDYRGSSHLYEVLSSFVAGDAELLEIASHGQTAIPNLFFGAVHYLLMDAAKESLAEYYPSLHNEKKSGTISFHCSPIFLYPAAHRVTDRDCVIKNCSN